MEKVGYKKTFQTSPIIRQGIKDLKCFDDGDDNEDDMKLDLQQHLFLLWCHFFLLIRIVCVCVCGEYPGNKTAQNSMS